MQRTHYNRDCGYMIRDLAQAQCKGIHYVYIYPGYSLRGGITKQAQERNEYFLDGCTAKISTTTLHLGRLARINLHIPPNYM